MERLSVGLKPVETFEDWRLPLENGYFPHLTAGNGFIWGDRQDDTLMQVSGEIHKPSEVAFGLL